MTKILSRLNDEVLTVDMSPVIASGDIGTISLIVGFDFNWTFTTPAAADFTD